MPFPRWTVHPPTFASMVKESVKVCEVVHTPKKKCGTGQHHRSWFAGLSPDSVPP
jgi:hypothetical protein